VWLIAIRVIAFLSTVFDFFSDLQFFHSLTLHTSGVSRLQADHAMAIRVVNVEQEAPRNPWVETPLRESYALSEAAGWYGHAALFITILDS
jgi:hypothetical protein